MKVSPQCLLELMYLTHQPPMVDPDRGDGDGEYFVVVTVSPPGRTDEGLGVTF